MRPPFTATPPFSITRRAPSIVTTVPPRTIRSTAVFLLCAIVADCAAQINRISRIKAKRFSIFVQPKMKRGLPATFYLKQNASSLQSRRHIGSPGREPGVENEKEFESPEGAKENSAHVGEYVLSPAFAG